MYESSVAIVGLGNVGYWCAIHWILAAVQSLGQTPWFLTLIDFDIVDDRAVTKGYPPDLIGQTKPTALYEVIIRLFGPMVAKRVHPIVAAAEAVPGRIAACETIFICVDAYGPAAFVSRLAAPHWQCRLSTASEAHTLATHNLEVFPAHTATLEMAYDTAAWATAGLHKACLTGVPLNPMNGVAFPLGTVTSALAIQAWLNREQEKRPYRLTGLGTQVSRADWGGDIRPAPLEIWLSHDATATLTTIWQQIADDLGVAESDLIIDFELPWVVRRCRCGTKIGFEQYPIRAECPVCQENRLLLASSRLISYQQVATFGNPSLQALSTPIGVGLVAESRNGDQRRYRLQQTD